MIEMSLEMCNDMNEIIQSKDIDVTETLEGQFKEKYDIDFYELDDIINDYIDEDYLSNNIYHIVPIVTGFSLIINTLLYVFLQKNTSI